MIGVLRRHPRFRRLWLAQVVSSGGDWLNRVAVLTLIGVLGGGPAVAGVGALFGVELMLRLLPTALLGPLAGPVADRVPRRLLMVASDLVRMGVVLALLLVDGPEDLPLLYVLVALQMGVAIFFDAARTAALPSTVTTEDIHAAYTLSGATWSAMLAVGAALGGTLVEIVGVRGVFLLDAGTYVVSAALLWGLALPPVPAHPEPFRWRDVLLLTDLRRGLAHARGRGLLPVLLAKAFWWPAGGFLVMLSVVGSERFGRPAPGADPKLALGVAGAAGFATGMLYSARGLGTGVGPILARLWLGSTDRALRLSISLGFAVAIAGYAAFAVADDLVLSCLCVFAAHTGGSTIWVASTTYWQKHVDDAFRGRVFALEFLGMTLAFSAGGLVAGHLYDRLGAIAPTVWALCAALVVFGAAWTLWARRLGVDAPPEPARV